MIPPTQARSPDNAVQPTLDQEHRASSSMLPGRQNETVDQPTPGQELPADDTGQPTEAAPEQPAGSTGQQANEGIDSRTDPTLDSSEDASIDLSNVLEESQVMEVLQKLDQELVGLKSVKTRIREIAALLLVERMRRSIGLAARPPSLHMSFTGPPGTGKTTVALRMATILHRLSYVRKGHLVAVTRDDLVGQYIGHTAPKTRDVLKRAMGGVLFIDEAYYLYRQENERDYGQEAIEILLQVMENQRDDLVVVLAGYKERMETFFQSNPGVSSRIAHHLDFPNYTLEELLAIAQLMLAESMYRLSPEAQQAFAAYLKKRMHLPRFANARSVRNAIDRARLRQANRLFAKGGRITKVDLMTIEAEDILASRVFSEEAIDEEHEPQTSEPPSKSGSDAPNETR